jgi:DNA repair exonuclease SbcCD ATPase subunit
MYGPSVSMRLKPNCKAQSRTKNVVIALSFALLLASTPGKAQQAATSAAAINAGLSSIGTISKQIDQIDNVTFPELKKKQQNLDDVTEMLNGAATHLKAKYADLEQRDYDHDAAIERHNANQCKGTEEECAAYTAEAHRLNEATAALKREAADLDTYKQGLRERFEQLSADTIAWSSAVKKAQGDRDDLAERGKTILSSLASYANTYGSCMDRYPDDDDEGLKHHCGNVQFDGVRENIGKLRISGSTPFFGHH